MLAGPDEILLWNQVVLSCISESARTRIINCKAVTERDREKWLMFGCDAVAAGELQIGRMESQSAHARVRFESSPPREDGWSTSTRTCPILVCTENRSLQVAAGTRRWEGWIVLSPHRKIAFNTAGFTPAG